VAGLMEGNVRGVSTRAPSINIRRSASCSDDLRVIVDASVIHTPYVMETSFSSSANHTFAARELKKMKMA
jgi:hypothetical protein